MQNILFIGLGTMGRPMARCLAAQGFAVQGWDLSETACARFNEEGGQLAGPLDVVLAQADAVITMLPEGADVAEVYERQVFPLAKTGALMIDCSTIDVETARQVSAAASTEGFEMIDAPVSGGAEGAAAGTLSFMVGGPGSALARARPLLEAMGAKLAHFGPAGNGQAAKACHNMICGITALGICEAFALADGLGLDLQAFFDLCKGAAAQSWILENRCPVPGPAPDAPASKGYQPGFAAFLMAKDLRLAQAAAQASGQVTPFGAEAARRFTEFAEADGGRLDFSAIYRTIRGP